MPAKTIVLPNLKKMFLPDAGFFICDSDLAQADAQVVAWDANDKPLKDFFKAAREDDTLDLHGQNAADIFGGEPTRKNPNRKKAKAGVHAVNYFVQARTLALTLGVTIYEAEKFIDIWFTAHPAIYDWQETIRVLVQKTRQITNKFGNRKIFFGRLERVLPEALAWIPQSTVALVINRAWKNLDDMNVPDIQVLLQVHDSLVYQIKQRTFRRHLEAVEEAFKIVVPYDDPLIIPAGLSYSVHSWGEVRESDWRGKFL